MTTLPIPDIGIGLIDSTTLTYTYINDFLASLYHTTREIILDNAYLSSFSNQAPFNTQFINNFISSSDTTTITCLNLDNITICFLFYKLNETNILVLGLDIISKFDTLTKIFNYITDSIVVYFNNKIIYCNESYNKLLEAYPNPNYILNSSYFKVKDTIYRANNFKVIINENIDYHIYIYKDVTLEMTLTSELENQVNLRTSELNKEIIKHQETESKLKALLDILPTKVSKMTISKVTNEPLNHIETEVLLRKLEEDVSRISKTLYYNGTAITGRVHTLEGNIVEDRSRLSDVEKKLDSFNNILYLYNGLTRFLTSQNGLISLLVISGLFFGFGAHQKVYLLYKQTLQFLHIEQSK